MRRLLIKALKVRWIVASPLSVSQCTRAQYPALACGYMLKVARGREVTKSGYLLGRDRRFDKLVHRSIRVKSAAVVGRSSVTVPW